ncbi:MAG: hypothetical protein ABI912_12085 [Actinomycetota bacterium]
MHDDTNNAMARMTAAQSRVLRRAKKLRALRLLSPDLARRNAANDPAREQARQAMREWGALTPLPISVRRTPRA